MRTRPLSIYQANVGKGRANHLLALQLAYKHNFDIVCIQEPWVHREYHRKFVCSHPGFDTFVALDVWDADNKPRAVSYTRKGAGLQADQLRPYGPQPDIIVLKVNDLTVYNIYNSHAKENAASLMARAAHQPPAQKTVVLGDFNTHHRRWEPALTQAPTRQAQALIRWIDKRKLLVLNEPGQPTHSRGHVLDLALCTPDLLLRKASVMLDSTLDSTSDHSTLALSVPIAQRAPANTGRLLIGQIDKELYTSRLASYPLPQAPQLDTPEALDKEAADLTSAILSVAKCLAPRTKESAQGNPWWTKAVVPRQVQARQRPGGARRARRTITKAKAAYYQNQIANATVSKEVFRNSWLAPARGSLFNSPTASRPGRAGSLRHREGNAS